MTDETPFGQPRPYPAKPETDETPLGQPHPYPAPAGTPVTSGQGVKFFSGKVEPSPKPPAPAPAAPDPIKGGEPTEASEAEHRRKAADEEHDANPKPTPELQSQPVRVDGRNRRNANDGLEGHFVDVVDGEHKGRFGAFTEVAEREKDGYPKTILVRTRDEFNELLTVAYEHVRHSQSHGGR
jgi:hypothetical protein